MKKRACIKKSYPSEGKALAAGVRVLCPRKKLGSRMKFPTGCCRVYLCPYCGMFHLTKK